MRPIMWLSTSLYLIAAAIMFGLLMPAVGVACGHNPPLDGRFTWGARDAAEFAGSCTPTGLRAYAQMQILDLFYPALLALALIVWARWLGERLKVRRGVIVIIGSLALTGAAFDYLENLAAWTLIRTGVATAGIFDIGGIFSLLKNLSGTFAILATLTLAAGYAVTTAKARLRPSFSVPRPDRAATRDVLPSDGEPVRRSQ